MLAHCLADQQLAVPGHVSITRSAADQLATVGFVACNLPVEVLHELRLLTTTRIVLHGAGVVAHLQ